MSGRQALQRSLAAGVRCKGGKHEAEGQRVGQGSARSAARHAKMKGVWVCLMKSNSPSAGCLPRRARGAEAWHVLTGSSK